MVHVRPVAQRRRHVGAQAAFVTPGRVQLPIMQQNVSRQQAVVDPAQI